MALADYTEFTLMLKRAGIEYAEDEDDEDYMVSLYPEDPVGLGEECEPMAATVMFCFCKSNGSMTKQVLLVGLQPL